MTGLVLSAALLSGCWWYSFSGISLPASVQTIYVGYIDNRAPLVNPALSNIVTEQLKDKFLKLTRLSLVDEDDDWDLRMEGEITDYETRSIAVTAEEVATMQRLTITLRITFENKEDPSQSFDNRQFSKFSDYPATRTLGDVESTLVPEIVEQLIEEIFNAAVAGNW
ncbi:MAG: LPS assembly lipoprotein LptE [Bacteroidales bacterium]|nr:LPS assembly lipoprotein LptE [Bacteroidales bacterium]MCL2738273.1 LPS assembly lipoprotein LptE [Bacteroidales bacterium]